MFRKPSLAALVCIMVALVVSRGAPAQTTAGTTPTIAPPIQNYFPDRFQNGADIGTGPRPQNLNPTGISYQDCINDQSLAFNLLVSGFGTGTPAGIQVWASRGGDCTMEANRTNGATAVCWPLGVTLPTVNSPASQSLTFTVRVQDIVGPQNTLPSPTSYTRQGPSACLTQPTYAGETFNIYFLPIVNGATFTGTDYLYTLNVDLQGPPPPAAVSIADGDTLFVVNWMANTDTDTAGYDVYIDPVPGQEGAVGSEAPPEPVLICPEAASSSDVDAADGTTDAADDATMSASATDASESVDAGCHYGFVGGSTTGSAGACGDPALAGGIVSDSGTTVISTADDSGLDGAPFVPGNGGISTISTNFLLGAAATGLTVPGISTSSHTISGLRDNTRYTVAVSAVDAYGNVGPPSVEQCDSPAPVNDFWKEYRNDGGLAGGGFCTLETIGKSPSASFAGLVFLASVAAVGRRRRRRGTG
jgi:hypothetical protein